MEFKDIIKTLRKENHLTQEELAIKVDLRRSTYANYERGIRTPSPELLKKLSELFDVSIDYLLGYEDKNTKLEKYINKFVSLTENNDIKWVKISSYLEIGDNYTTDKISEILRYNDIEYEIECDEIAENSIEPYLYKTTQFKKIYVFIKDNYYYIFVENNESDFVFISSKSIIKIDEPSSLKITSDDTDLTRLHNAILYNLKNINDNLLNEFMNIIDSNDDDEDLPF